MSAPPAPNPSPATRDERVGRLRDRKWEYAWRAKARFAAFAARHKRAANLLARAVAKTATLYARLELPRGVGLLETTLVALPGAFLDTGEAECTGLWHRYRLRLDRSDYFQRLTLYLRRYHDVPTQLVIWRAVRPGDTVIDGGANIGLISLLAAWRTGPGGRVYAFEPGPAAANRLRWHASQNSLAQIDIRELGLSDTADEIPLTVPAGDNLGAGTFAPLPERHTGAREVTIARTAPADALGLDIRGSLVVKLDIEGYELRALRGMSALIERCRPLLLTEVNREMLAQAGASAPELAGFLTDRGYRPFEYTTHRTLLRQRRLVLREISGGEEWPLDVAWIHPQGAHRDRLARFIRPAGRGAAG